MNLDYMAARNALEEVARHARQTEPTGHVVRWKDRASFFLTIKDEDDMPVLAIPIDGKMVNEIERMIIERRGS